MILKTCIGARAALGELKTAGELIPNQAILINMIPLLEARTSSEIENLVTTADRLFRSRGATHVAAGRGRPESCDWSLPVEEGTDWHDSLQQITRCTPHWCTGSSCGIIAPFVAYGSGCPLHSQCARVLVS